MEHVFTESMFLVGFVIFIAAILVLDMLVIDRKAHVVSIKEAGSWTAVWIILALAFAVFIYFHGDMVHGIENFDDLKHNMCVHPDDPPYPVFGLPRIIGRAEDIQWMLDAVPNKHNGLTFCAGSFSAGEHNDCVAMAKQFADRTHFVHLRSCYIFPNGNFTEASHLGGRGHLIELCRIFEKAEQEGKCNSGRRLPMRVDHGMTFTDEPGGVFDESNHGHNAGYTLLGRMFAMGQIQGVIATVDDELGIEYKQPGFYD